MTSEAMLAAQDPVNMLAAIVCVALFVGACGALVAHWWLSKVLDGDRGHLTRYCGYCLREIKDDRKWRLQGCDCKEGL